MIGIVFFVAVLIATPAYAACWFPGLFGCHEHHVRHAASHHRLHHSIRHHKAVIIHKKVIVIQKKAPDPPAMTKKEPTITPIEPLK